MTRLGWLGLVVVVTGCATTPKWAAATTMAEEKFPPRAELQKVALRVATLDTAKHDRVVVETWTLVGPFPSEAVITPVKPSTAWEQALQQAVPAVGNALTADLQCVAREVAHFMAIRKDYPGKSLQKFIERRCATTAARVRLTSLTGELPDKLSEAEWISQWKDDLAKLAQPIGVPDLAGLSVQREGKFGVMVLASADVFARFSQPVPLVGTTGSVVVRGRLGMGGAERIGALINKGALSVAECKTLDALSPPEFAFECPVEAGDVRTTLELVKWEPGRILGTELASFTLWPKGAPVSVWQRPTGSGDVPKGLFNTRFLAAVNELRAGSGLSQLKLSEPQSATAGLLAPHYFAASFGEGDALDADRIALGMMAGWDVGQDIVSSGFGSEWLSGTRDLAVYLEFVLDSPYERKAVTEPRATLLAVGSVESSASSLAAIFSTYVPLGKFDRKEAEIAIITRLNQMRLDRKLGLAQWTLWPQDEGAVVEANLGAKRWGPNDAANYALEKTAEVAKGRVTGYVQLVDDLDNFQFPPEVLSRPDINVFLAVGVYRGDEWAQSRYVVCFVIARSNDIETASR